MRSSYQTNVAQDLGIRHEARLARQLRFCRPFGVADLSTEAIAIVEARLIIRSQPCKVMQCARCWGRVGAFPTSGCSEKVEDTAPTEAAISIKSHWSLASDIFTRIRITYTSKGVTVV